MNRQSLRLSLSGFQELVARIDQLSVDNLLVRRLDKASITLRFGKLAPVQLCNRVAV